MRGHEAILGAAGTSASGQERAYDAIVVGSGAAGGLAALLLGEANLDVLVLDAGWQAPVLRAPYKRSVNAIVPLLAELRALPLPYALTNLGQKGLKLAGRVRQPVQSKSFAWPMSPASFVDDRDFPYAVASGSRFDWFRAHQIGGRMTIPGHGRQYHRLDADAFDAHWPVTASELGPWYSVVEKRLGVAADGNTSTPAETETLNLVNRLWPQACASLGRSAPPLNSVALAANTGRVHCRQGAVVRQVDVDGAGRVTGVTWADRGAGEVRRARAPIVFLCASALETARILMTSRSARLPEGIGAASGALGRYVMDHITMSAEGEGPALPGPTTELTPGRCVFVSGVHGPGEASYGMQIYRWSKGASRSHFSAVTFGEMAPRAENRLALDMSTKDACGNPTLRIECRYNENDIAAAAGQSRAIRDVAEMLGVKVTRLDVKPPPPGTAMHECGGARMGDSPENSVLDPDCQAWDARGLYVTDGAAFPSQGTQHPTLTIKALTARACARVTGASALEAAAQADATVTA